MNTKLRFIGCLAALWLSGSIASAHPVPKDTHDRAIVVRLQKGGTVNQIRVRVEYRLEVDVFTVEDSDMRPFKVDLRGEALYAEFTKTYAPIFAANFVVRVDKTAIEDWRVISRKETLHDDDGKSLGHLRCDFVFETTLHVDPEKRLEFFFLEKNYYLQEGQIVLSFVNETGRAVETKTEPDDAFRKHAKEQPEPGDDDRLRTITVVLAPVAPTEAPITGTPAKMLPRETHTDWFDLRRLIQHTGYGFWLIMLLAFLFGGAHALTPGHGKTLVAAYLVGERGTVWHACYLGLVTTLTHTGAVMIIALILTLLPDDMQQAFKTWVQNGLGLVMGLIVACMGFWLLLQRLAGRADHVHLDGGHHHGATEAPAARSFGWWGLTVLGITGGIIPCWDAVGVLFWSVGTKEMWLVLPAVLVFSAGLAVVLVNIGILIVLVPRLVEGVFGSGRLLRALPIVSAVLVTLMGLWLCYEGTRGM